MEKRFKKWKKPIIKEGKLTKWNWIVQGVKSLKLGKETDIGAFVYINAEAGVVVEDGVQIGAGTKIYSISTIDNKKGRVLLKKKCKIGANSVIMPGVTVGENSIIGAFSFVNKNIPDDVVAFGIPVKVIKKVK
ncbi:acyltransferase [Patescibacteria group bacterium]|nr:acyltransferase [Patescibacteria group bacterium]MBU4274596.1 acyltransferase [Patescibacteria group bacterium]MCG2699961.1 acyltransferase [Candidatus Parcubacteria bacterium]